MVKLRSEKKVIFEVQYQDLESFVKEIYPKTRGGIKSKYDDGYSFVATQECGNDCSFSFKVDDEKMDEYDQEDWNKFKETGGVPDYNNALLLQGLCIEGHIEPGEYLIEVSW